MPKTVKVSRAPQAREKYVKVCECAARLGAPDGEAKFGKSCAWTSRRERVKVASQRDRHKMVKVSEGAENIPSPYATLEVARASPRRG